MTIVSNISTATLNGTDTPTTDRLTLPGVPWLAASINGTNGVLTVGPLAVPVHVTPAADGGPARIEAEPTQLTLSQISVAAVAAGGSDPLAALPSSLAAFVGGIAISRVGVSLDLSTRTVTAVDVTIAADLPWSVVAGHVEVTDLQLTMHYERAGDSHTVAVTGGGIVAGSAVELTVQRKDNGSFAVSLSGPAGAGIAMPSFAEVAGLVGGADLALPSGLGDLPGLVLSGVEVVFTAAGVQSVHATVTIATAWNLPDPIGISVHSVAVAISAEHPADAATSVVQVSVEGTATFAGAGIAVRLERAEGRWTLTGGLDAGSTLTASAIAAAYGAGLPAHLPELALSEFAITAVLGAGELSVRAASTSEWTVPIGPDGIGVSNLVVQFSRHAVDAAGRTFSGSIAGEVHLAGIVMPVSYSVPGGLKLTAVVPSVAPFALLQDFCGETVVGSLELPDEILTLRLTGLQLTIDVERSEVSFAATGPGFKRVQAIVRKGTSWGFAVGIALDDHYRFSSLSSALAGLDAVELPDALIVISTFDDTGFTFDELQPIAGVGVERGLLVDGRLGLAALGAEKILGRPYLDVTAHVGSKLSDLSLAAGIGDLTITKGVLLKNAEFELVPNPQNLSVKVLGALDVTIDASPLEFIGGMEIVPNGINFFATMKGSWKDPFGAKGVALSNVSLKLGSDFEGIPTIGIAGGLRIGTFDGSAAVQFNSEFPTQSVLIVAFNELSLLGVIDTFCPPSVIGGIPADIRGTLAGIGLENVDLYVVPQDTSIGKISYQQGLRVAGTLHVAGFAATAGIEIDPQQGVSVAGSLSPVHVGDVFSLTGDNTDQGPSLDIQAKTTAAPMVAISGRASLLGLTAGAHISLSDKGFDFGCEGKVFGAFDAAVTAKGSSLQSADGFTVHAQMSQSFLADLTGRAARVLQQAGADASAKIASAQHDVDNAEIEVKRLGDSAQAAGADLEAKRTDARRQLEDATNKVAKARDALAELDRQIASTKNTIKAERDASDKKIRDAQEAVTAARRTVDVWDSKNADLQGQIDQLNRDIDWWNNWYNTSSKAWKAVRWARLGKEVAWRGVEIGKLTGEIGALKLARKADDLLLQGAEKILQEARSAAATYPIDQDPRVLRLQGDRGLADLALRGATDFLRLTQQTTDGAITLAGQTYNGLVQQLSVANGVLERTKGALGLVKSGVGALAGVAGYIAEHGLGALLDVRSASFDGSLNATSGGSVTLDADVVFQGTGLVVQVSYDFHDLVAGAKALAKAVVPSLSI